MRTLVVVLAFCAPSACRGEDCHPFGAVSFDPFGVEKKTPCGREKCDCGCKDGFACTCAVPKKAKAECVCKDCPCPGSRVGNVCDCSPQRNKFPCSAECTCGCNGGDYCACGIAAGVTLVTGETPYGGPRPFAAARRTLLPPAAPMAPVRFTFLPAPWPPRVVPYYQPAYAPAPFYPRQRVTRGGARSGGC